MASEGGHHARVDRDHPVVVGQVVLAIRGDHRLELPEVVAPLGELHAERRADASKPVIVGARRDAVGGEGVMVAVEDQADRIDERAVEIEQHGLNSGHGRKASEMGAGLRARHAIPNLNGPSFPELNDAAHRTRGDHGRDHL